MSNQQHDSMPLVNEKIIFEAFHISYWKALLDAGLLNYFQFSYSSSTQNHIKHVSINLKLTTCKDFQFINYICRISCPFFGPNFTSYKDHHFLSSNEYQTTWMQHPCIVEGTNHNVQLIWPIINHGQPTRKTSL